MLWCELDPATQAHSLAVTGGRVEHGGIAGLTLGGGIGWMARAYGLTCDSLIGADLVTADGELVHVTPGSTPELLWALRGGGGNFGVVTRFEYALHPVGPYVIAGLMVYPPERTDVLGAWEEFCKHAPDELSTTIAMQRTPKALPGGLQMMPDGVRNREGYMLSYCSLLEYERTLEALAPLRELQPSFEIAGPLLYTGLQTLTDGDHPYGVRSDTRGHRLARLDAGAIDVIIEYFRTRSRTGSRMFIEHMEGAAGRVPEWDTAYPDRTSPYSIVILGMMRDDADVAGVKAWTRGLWRDLKPYGAGASYLNWLGLDEEPDRVEATFGPEKYRRLAEIKWRWDPENLFRLNANIKPAPRCGQSARYERRSARRIGLNFSMTRDRRRSA